MVRTMHSNLERRHMIVALMKLPGANVHSTARAVHCSVKLVRKWWRRYCATGSVDDATRVGRPVSISRAGAKLALRKLVHEDGGGSNAVAQHLAAVGITNRVVHKTTVIRAARRAADEKGKKLQAKKGPPPKGLTQATKAKRIAFARANKKMNWGMVMFTDRKRFYLKYPGSKVKPYRWVLEGEAEQDVFQPTNPLCVNVYAGITPFGMTTMHFVAGTSKLKTEYKTQKDTTARNITKSEYKEVLMKTLLPEGTKLFKKGKISKWHFQQDNDPTHGIATTVLAEWNRVNGASVQLLPNWPPSSPDLNIIENVWASVQQKVNMLGCKDFEQFKGAVQETFASVSQQVTDNLYNSLKKRMELVINNGGDYTKY